MTRKSPASQVSDLSPDEAKPASTASGVAAWLRKQGYPVEMSVARSFRAARCRVQQSEYYRDPETAAIREIDVVATWQRTIDGRPLRIAVPIECKLATKRPWVVFTDPSIRLAGPARVAQRAASNLGSKYLDLLAKRNNFVQDYGLFLVPPRPGYALTEAFTSGKDRAYEALAAVTSAAAGLARELDRTPVTAIFFPMIVLDGLLFECFLDNHNEIVVQGVDGTVILWRNPVVRMPHTIVHIITVDALPELIKQTEFTVEELVRHNEILAEAVGRPPGAMPE